MKKIKIIVIVLLAFLCVGCGSGKSATRDFYKDVAKNKIADITFSESQFTFSNTSNINNKDALSVYGVDISKFEDYLFYISSDVVDPSMYLIVKPSDDDKSIVKYQVNELFSKYFNAYNNYYPKEAKMITDRLEKEYEGYLIYIVSYNNEKVYQAIKDSFK